MTCIVGVADAGRVYIGGDSAGVSGYVTFNRSDPKVFAKGSFLIGFTTSFRMGQLLRYAFHAPERPDGMDAFEYMVTMFVENLRECLNTGGFAKKELERESGGSFLVGYAERLFFIDDDYQVGESADGYMAVGSGAEVALGAMYATRGLRDAPLLPPRIRIGIALEAAAHCNVYVRAPFVIEEL